MNKEFRNRGEESSRIEGLSDSGFALAIGLLLISTSPPESFDDLLAFTRDLIPFGICITLITLVWNQHVVFFLRYGFRNKYVVILNTLLLFIILFYVYPLKFLARFLTTLYAAILNLDSTAGGRLNEMIHWNDIPRLMVIYGLGASSIFFVLVLMYRYAFKKASELDLNAIEIFDTKTSVVTNLLLGIIPLISVLAALAIPSSLWAGTISGFLYFLYFPVMTIYGRIVKRRRQALLDASDF